MIIWLRVLILLFCLSPVAYGEEPPTLDELDKLWLNLQRQETVLGSRYEGLISDGSRADDILAELRKVESSLTAPERAELAKAKKITDIKEPLKAKIEQAIQRAKMGDERLKQLHGEYDAFNLEKLDYFIKKYHRLATDTVSARGDNRKDLKETLAKLEEKYREYQEKKKLFATLNDVERLNVYRSYFSELERFANQAAWGQRTFGENVSRPFQAAGWLARMLIDGALILPSVPGLYEKIFRKHKDFTPEAAEALGRVLWANGYKQKLEGRKFIPREPEEGVINFYTPIHTNAVLDAATVTQLGLKDYVVFAAVKEFGLDKIPLDQNELFINVRGEGNPVKKLISLAKDRGVKNVVIMPEGNLSSSVGYETRPPAEQFAGMLTLLRRQGFRVNVIPVTMPHHFRMRDEWQGLFTPGDKELLTIVHEPISPVLTDILMLSGDPQALSRLIRQQWIDTIQNRGSGSRMMGMPLIEEIERQLERHISRRSRCRVPFNILKPQTGTTS